MKDNYELTNPRLNPYSERMKNGYTIIIERNINESDEVDIKKTDNNIQLQTSSKNLDRGSKNIGC